MALTEFAVERNRIEGFAEGGDSQRLSSITAVFVEVAGGKQAAYDGSYRFARGFEKGERAVREAKFAGKQHDGGVRTSISQGVSKQRPMALIDSRGGFKGRERAVRGAERRFASNNGNSHRGSIAVRIAVAG